MNHKKNLDQLKVGEIAIIEGFQSNDQPDKYLEMGVIPGEKCMLLRKAPFNGPLCLQLMNQDSIIALRKGEASQIKIMIING